MNTKLKSSLNILQPSEETNEAAAKEDKTGKA